MSAINRRQAMLTTGAALTFSACRHPPSSSEGALSNVAADISTDRLHADLKTYEAFGIHRSGSAADIATCDWLAHRLEALDYEVERRAINVDNYDARVSTVASRTETFTLAAQAPFFAEPECHVEGELVYCGQAGLNGDARNRIIVADAIYGRASSYEAANYRKLADLALGAEARALILITNGPSSEAVWLNIKPDAKYPLTALCAPKQADGIRAAARRGDYVVFETPPRQAPRTATSILATRSGPLGYIVISTPVSGWTYCAGERGPGIATMLALAAWLPQVKPGYSITLIGTNGHELGDLGMRDLLKHAPPSLAGDGLWFHLGAGFAARDWYELPTGLAPMESADPQRFLLASNSFINSARRAFQGLPGLEKVHQLTPETAAGELRLIARAGYRHVLGIFGAHRYHHSMSDQMEMTSGDLLKPVVQAVGELLQGI